MREVFAANKGEIAGIILEPVVGNSGYIAPSQEFLQVSSLPLFCLSGIIIMDSTSVSVLGDYADGVQKRLGLQKQFYMTVVRHRD